MLSDDKLYRDGEAFFRKIAPPKHRDHDVVFLYDGDSPHPTAVKCEEAGCGWTGTISEAP